MKDYYNLNIKLTIIGSIILFVIVFILKLL